MRIENQITHPRLLRKTARDDGPPAAGPGAGESRFLGAAVLDDPQKTRIARALRERRIGDEVGRQIFIAALEYQLCAFGPELVRVAPAGTSHEPQDALERALRGLLAAARRLAGLLRELPMPARTAVARELAQGDAGLQAREEAGLAELGTEVERVAEAGAVAADARAAHLQPGPPPDLVMTLAKAFSECFEQSPTADPDGPFHASLEVVAEVTGLAIAPAPGVLERALGDRAIAAEIRIPRAAARAARRAGLRAGPPRREG